MGNYMDLLAEYEILGPFNVAEAAWWFLMAVVVRIYWQSCKGLTPRLRDVLVVFLVGFGISDLIEMQTGAWWRPVWLLLLKAVCLIGLLTCGLIVWRNRARTANVVVHAAKRTDPEDR